jgi:hypothetical protein
VLVIGVHPYPSNQVKQSLDKQHCE